MNPGHDRTRRRLLQLGAGLAASGLLSPALAAAPPRRMIIDTDPGQDDALAIFLALRSPEVKVEALTAVAGNLPLEVTLGNALKILDIAARPDIPVAAGAARPLRRRLSTTAYANGENGFGGVQFPASRLRPVAEPAAVLIRRIVRASPGQVSLVALGPLTNLATAFRDDPALPGMLASITLMGGSLSGGNISPAAEFNFYADPEAAQAVFRCGAPITMVGLDVTRKAWFEEPHIRALETASTAVGRASGQLIRAAFEQHKVSGADGGKALAHDSMAMASLIQPGLFRLQDEHIEIETEGALTAGESLAYRRSPMRASALVGEGPAQANTFGQAVPNARVALDVDAPRFLDFLIGRLTHG